MNRQDLINRLVARKLQAGTAKAGCVPCFGSAQAPARRTPPAAVRRGPRAEAKL